MEQQSQAEISKYVLPPGAEGNTTYGYLYVEIGNLLFLRGAKVDKTKVKVKFWGDRGDGQILRPINASRELGGIPTTIQYQIRCDMINFRNYLQDAVKLHFFVLDSRNDKPLGRVSLLTNFYIKHHLNKEDLNPLNEINDAFPVEKLAASNSREPTEEIGKLEIKINAAFVQQTSRPLDESIAVPRGLLDESRNHLNSSFLQNEMNAREATRIVPSDLYAPEEPVPDITYNRDYRIPKSLQQQKPDDQYNAGGFTRVPVTNTLEQARRDRDTQQQRQIQSQSQSQSQPQFQPQLQESLSRSGMRAPPTNNLSDQQMDNQIDQLFNFAQNLRDNMASAENNRSFVNASVPQFQTMQSPMREMPKSAGLPSSSITQLFTNTQDNCVDLVKEKLRIEHDALVEDNEGGNQDAEPQRDSGKGGLNFNQIDGLKIRINEFICENINFREKINDRKIYVECLVPSSVSTAEHPVYDTYKFFSGDSEGLVWQFNNEFTKNIAQKEGEFKRLFSSNIIFKIFMANQDPANKTAANYNFEVASGELNVEKVILSPGYAGQFYIKMSSKAPLTQAAQTAKPDSKTPSKTTGRRGASPAPVPQKTTKAANSLVKSETLTEVGDLKVFCKFTGGKVEDQEEKPKSSMAQTRQEPRSENTFLPLQALLYIDRIPKIINRKDAQFPFRNVYIAFRIYGTSEKVQTETRWKTNTPYFDCKLIFPISLDHLVKMYNFPFTLEVWDKSEGSKDELLGLVKLNLEAVPKALIDAETEEINYATITASQYPILVCDEAQPIKDLKSNQENGQVLVTLAVGTALQLSKLENSRLKQKRNDYTETSADIRGSPLPGAIQREEFEVELPEKDEAPKRQSPQKKASTFKKYEVNFEEGDKGASLTNSYDSFIEVMERIRRHSDLATVQAKPLFMEQEEEFVNTKELSDFILDPSNNMKAEYCRKTVKLLDIEKRGLVHRDFFTRSYLTYVDYETDVRSRFSEVVRDLKVLLNKQNMSVLAFEKILNSHSEYGFIKRSFLKETFEKMKLNVSPKMMEYILNLLDYENNGLVFISHLTDYLKALEVYNRLNYLNLNPHFFIENVSSVIKEVLRTKDITKEKLDETFGGSNVEDQTIRIDDVMQIMQRIGCQLTFFEALSLMEHIKSKMNVINSDDSRVFINSKVLYTWLYLTTISEITIQDEAPVHDVESEQPAMARKSPEKYQLDQFHESDSFDDINDLLNNKRPNTSPAKSPHKPSLAERERSLEKERIPSPKNASPKNIRERRDEDEIIETKKPVASPKAIETRTKGKPPRVNRGLLKHVLRFTINEINQLNLGQRHDGEKCTVRYIFPSTQDLIESNLIEVSTDKKTYPVGLVSKYTWTLSKNDDIVTQFQNSSGGVILQLVKKNETIDEILGYTVLPFEEFSTLIDRAVEDGSATNAEGSLHKTLLLYRSGQAKANFSFQNDLVIGKLSVFIEYERTRPIVEEREFDSDSDTQGKNKQTLRAGKHRSQSRDRPETIYENEIIVQRDFPKKGYFLFKIEGISELKRGLEYALERNQEVQELLGNRYGGGAKLAIYFDLFWEEPELKHVVAPFEVELLSRQIDFNEIIVNKTVSKYAEASSELIEYLQYKTARVEVRLHLKDKALNEDEEELSQSTRREPHYVVICSCKIPLLSVLTSDRGLQGEFPLTNIMECYSGLLGLQLSFSSESKSGMGGRSAYLKNREKSLYVMALSFNELLSVMESEERGRTAVDRDDGEALCYLEFEVEGETKRSSFYSLNKWREVVPLEDCFFVFTIEAHSEFFRKPLEVRLLQKSKPKYQDKILGFASIDFFGVIKEHMSENKTFVDSFYCPLTDIERAKALKTRLGVKAGLVRVRNPLEARKLTKYLNEILTGELSKDSKKFRTQDAKLTGTISRTKLKDTFKQQTKLTYGELDDLGGLIAEEGDIVSWELFTREVRPNLHLDAHIDPQAWKSLLNEFAFYDYSEEGFISFDSAQTIVAHFSEDLPDLDENTLAKYKVKPEIRGLQMGYPKRVENMFDYVVFLNKLERIDPRDQYRRIDDNTRKVDAFLSAKQKSRSPSPYKTRAEQRQVSSGPLSLKVELQYGKNFQQLNNGKPPSSCVKCEVGPRSYARTQQQTSSTSFLETQVISRSADPDFNLTKDTTIQNFDEVVGQNNYGVNFLVYHRGFNPNHSEEMYKFEVIGEGFLSLNSILKPDGTIYFNDFLDIQPAYTALALTQTARPMLKVKITGEANLNNTVPVRDQRTINLKQTSPKRYQVAEDSDEDIERFDDNVINNVMRTLAEVNQETRSLHGSAKKAHQRHAWEEDNEREMNDRDFEERLQSHSKTMRDIADIHKNLDNIFDESSFAAGRERPLEQQRHEEPVPEEQDEGFETGRFNPGITKTNPFTNHLDTEETQPAARKEREAIRIAEDIKQEMPEDLKDIESSVRRDDYEEEKQAFEKENVSSGNIVTASEETEKKERSSKTSESGAKPPLATGAVDESSSTSTLRRIEQKFPKSMRNSGELARIARIMKPSGGEVTKKTYHYSSDSDY